MSEGLKQKIREKAYTLSSIYVDDVMDLLDEAIVEINQIMCEDYWTCNVHLNKVREKILAVLSDEKKVEG